MKKQPIPSWRIERVPLAGGETAAVLRATEPWAQLPEPGGRFHDAFEETCHRLGAEAESHPAVDAGDQRVSFAELRARSNQLARYLASTGVGPGDRIGLLLDRSADALAAVLACSKIGAAYVPLDISFPPDRIAYMLKDAGANRVLTLSRFAPCFAGTTAERLALDEAEAAAGLADSHFPPLTGKDADPVAYIIYTSGTTGRPKGVPIRHSSILNFVRVAAAMYGFHPTDRVYQGMTIAFDFSFEESWVPLAAGSTLVPAPSDAKLVGEDLSAFLVERRITALCVVPTLLATLPAPLPGIQFLMVSGEACPPDVISPWLGPDRRILNVYGPTETTVTATWAVLEPGCDLTIGGPLPTYSVVIVDPESGRPLEPGEEGELCIGGVGVFDGYLNDPVRTAAAFYADFPDLADPPGGKLYRSGDLARITKGNEIEYLGRIDTQVKIRGYRIELGEIEALARAVAGVGQAVVEPVKEAGGGTALAAYLTPEREGLPIDERAVDASLRGALPAYMVPSYYVMLERLPLLPSTKVDRKALPQPTGPRFAIAAPGQMIAPRTERETELTGLLKRTLRFEEVSVEADFFRDLGADSLLMAGFVSAVRTGTDAKAVSMREVYLYPSVARLAEWIDAELAAGGSASGGRVPLPSEAKRNEAWTAPEWARWLVGACQVALFGGWIFLLALALKVSLTWAMASTSAGEFLLRCTIASNAWFFGLGLLLIACKWLAVGRFDTRPIRLWSGRHLRFWIAKSAVRLNPFRVFIGTPLYSVFLRALGARIGRDVVFLGRPPVCVDLLTIGDRSVVRQEVLMNGYTAADGYLFPGPVEIGSDALVCEATTLGIFSKVGNGARVGIQSSVREGETVADGAKVRGTPVQTSEETLEGVVRREVQLRRKNLFCGFQLLWVVAVSPLGLALGLWLLARLMNTGWLAGERVWLLSAGLYFGGVVVAAVLVLIVPRLLRPFLVAEREHPLFGPQYQLALWMKAASNHKHLNQIFGDSSLVLYWLRALGYDLSRCGQTGSNFGIQQTHHSPFLCRFDQGTMVADGLSILNSEIVPGAFAMRQVTVAGDTYLGNDIHFPARAGLGPNCLIATKAAVPVGGTARSGTGLLGSPAFEIPRLVERDARYAEFKKPEVLRVGLRRKLQSNLVTLFLYFLRNWLLIAVALKLSLWMLDAFNVDSSGEAWRGAAAIAAAAVIFVFVSALLGVFFERLVSGFRRIQPFECSIYEPPFWAHERLWKLSHNKDLAIFNGTPFKPFFLRLQGARIGRRLFDDGSGFAEPSMVEVGDDCVLNEMVTIQCHSMEEGAFKADRVEVGRRCVAEPFSFIHYGVRMADASRLGANAFLMKGSAVAEGETWEGNPAREVS